MIKMKETGIGKERSVLMVRQTEQNIGSQWKAEN
jgi:hypothetical protein